MGRLCVLAAVAFAILAVNSYWRGGAVVVDSGYRLELLPLDRDVGAADGLYWHRGWLYVASEGTSSVYRLDSTGTVETLATGEQGFSSPEDLVVDDDGVVYFTDDDVGGLWRIAPGSQALQIDRSSPPLMSTEAIARLGSGDLLVGEGTTGQIVVFDSNGRQRSRFSVPGIHKPESIAVGDDGSLYIADDQGGCIVRQTASGKTEDLFTRRDGLQEPETIVLANRTLYVVDNKAGRLLRSRSGGPLEPIAQFGGELKNIQGIALDDGGVIYLSVQSDLRFNHGHLLRLVPIAK